MIEKILVGTTAEDAAGASLAMAAELALTHGAELVVLQLEPLIDARRVFDPAGIPARGSRVGRLGHDYPGLRVRASEARGSSLRTVCDVAAEERPDLIVIGHGGARRGQAPLSRRASNALVERAGCAVLLVAS